MSVNMKRIADTVEQIQKSIHPDVILLAAAKTRSLEEVEAVVQAGITHLGYNYIQEALPIIEAIGTRAKWHMIGHLQRNKARICAQYFDMVETVDSWPLAIKLNQYCEGMQKTLPVLIEVNSGKESNKTGVLPDEVEPLVTKIGSLKYLQIMGLMTMGPRFGNPEDSRPYFKRTREIFDRLAGINLPNVTMRYLSMGMSNSYQIAIEEGANIIRIGTKLFGER